jgi:hypothetical protein
VYRWTVNRKSLISVAISEAVEKIETANPALVTCGGGELRGTAG